MICCQSWSTALFSQARRNIDIWFSHIGQVFLGCTIEDTNCQLCPVKESCLPGNSNGAFCDDAVCLHTYLPDATQLWTSQPKPIVLGMRLPYFLLGVAYMCMLSNQSMVFLVCMNFVILVGLIFVRCLITFFWKIPLSFKSLSFWIVDFQCISCLWYFQDYLLSRWGSQSTWRSSTEYHYIIYFQ